MREVRFGGGERFKVSKFQVSIFVDFFKVSKFQKFQSFKASIQFDYKFVCFETFETLKL